MLLSCGGTQANKAKANPPQEEEQHLARRLPLSAYLGRAGLRWVLQIRPQALLSNRQFRADWSKVLKPKGIAALGLITGVDLEELREIWIAGYGLGTLYLLDGRRNDVAIEESFRNRAGSLGEARRPLDDLLLMTGVIDETPLALLRLDGHIVAIAEGDPGLLHFAEARALGKLDDAAAAFTGDFLRPLRDEYSEAPFRAFALGPFAEATDGIVAQFVSGILALSPSGEELTLEAKATGVWPLSDTTDGDMRIWLSQLLATSEFRAVGLDEASFVVPPACTRADGAFENGTDLTVCEIRASFNSRRLAEATWRLTSAEMGDIVGAGETKPRSPATK
jgi:hypothetical protein